MMSRKSLSPTKRLKVLLANDGKCYLCDGKILAGDKWDVEHPRALALLGADDESNWFPAHRACHAVKTKDDRQRIDKAKRVERKHMGIKPRSKFPNSRDGRWKTKIGGKTELRHTNQEKQSDS